MSEPQQLWIDDVTFQADVDYLENLWQRRPVGGVDLPVIDSGQGQPLVFVPILEHLEFVYARQIRAFSQQRRVILYRRQERRVAPPFTMSERVEELRQVLDSFALPQVDLLAHGDAAMLLFEFALRYPQRCRSLIIIAQGADYQISPHPLILLLHDLLVRLPVERFVPASLLRRTVINYVTAHQPHNQARPVLPRYLIEAQFRKIRHWPATYKYSVLPVIHYFDIRDRLDQLTMPVLLINRADDILAPEAKTRWLAAHLPFCAGYHVISGRERFFMYSKAQQINSLIATFLQQQDLQTSSVSTLS